MAFDSIQRHELTTENTLRVKWTHLTTSLETGDSEILSYEV